jgi:hypothetical protein
MLPFKGSQFLLRQYVKLLKPPLENFLSLTLMYTKYNSKPEINAAGSDIRLDWFIVRCNDNFTHCIFFIDIHEGETK